MGIKELAENVQRFAKAQPGPMGGGTKHSFMLASIVRTPAGNVGILEKRQRI